MQFSAGSEQRKWGDFENEHEMDQTQATTEVKRKNKRQTQCRGGITVHATGAS
jgi:hypothetical protein